MAAYHKVIELATADDCAAFLPLKSTSALKKTLFFICRRRRHGRLLNVESAYYGQMVLHVFFCFSFFLLFFSWLSVDSQISVT